jgi:hypothetical protein
MQPWLVRGCAMAVVYAAAETLLAEVQVDHPGSGSVTDPIVLAVLVGVSGLWAGVDGWLRKPNRGMNWFYAALIGGVLAGVLSVVARAAFVDQTGVWALGSAVTGDAAFIALLIMVPAGLGIAVGGRLEPPVRNTPAAGADADPEATVVGLEPVAPKASTGTRVRRTQGRRAVRSVPRG